MCGMAGLISASEKVSPRYMTAMRTVAMSMPPQPPEARPRFQPEKCPEITAPTPSAHNSHTPAWRFKPRASKYASSTF